MSACPCSERPPPPVSVSGRSCGESSWRDPAKWGQHRLLDSLYKVLLHSGPPIAQVRAGRRFRSRRAPASCFRAEPCEAQQGSGPCPRSHSQGEGAGIWASPFPDSPAHHTEAEKCLWEVNASYKLSQANRYTGSLWPQIYSPPTPHTHSQPQERGHLTPSESGLGVAGTPR